MLVFGAGTDYALLLISRYREELRRHRDKHEAMATALRQAGPAILASGLTVSLALLTLLFAVLNSNRGLGPLAALGVFMAMVAMLTALPAFLLAFPRHLRPLVPRYGSASAEATGFWARFSRRLFAGHTTRRPRLVAVITVTVMAVMALGLTQFRSDLSRLDFFRGHVQSVEGQSCWPRPTRRPLGADHRGRADGAGQGRRGRRQGHARRGRRPAAQAQTAAGLHQVPGGAGQRPLQHRRLAHRHEPAHGLARGRTRSAGGRRTAQNLDIATTRPCATPWWWRPWCYCGVHLPGDPATLADRPGHAGRPR